MTKKQWLHLPLVVLVVLLGIVAVPCAVVYGIVNGLLDYLHRVYMPSQYQYDPEIQGLIDAIQNGRSYVLANGMTYDPLEPGECTVPIETHGLTCNGWPREECLALDPKEAQARDAVVLARAQGLVATGFDGYDAAAADDLLAG